MRLDELLRARPGGQSGSGGGEKTQVVSLSDLQLSLSHQTERTIRGGNLSEAQVALLQRTEPRTEPKAPSPMAASSVWDRAPAAPAGPPPAARSTEPQAPAAYDDVPAAWRQRAAAAAAPAGVAAASVPLRGTAPPPLPAAQSSAHTQPGVEPPPRPVQPPPAPPVGAAAPPALGRAPAPPAVPAAVPSSAPGRSGAVGRALAQVKQASAVAAGAKRKVVNQVVVVFSCKGGAGATALAANTAWSAVQQQQTACILDLDLQLGDALAALGLTPRFSLAQAVGLLNERQPLTRSLLPSHSSGVHVLSQVGSLTDLDRITPEAVQGVMMALRQQFDTVLVDGARDFGDNVLAVLDAADKVVIVCVQEVLAIRRARWAFSILRKIGFEAADISIVINRYAGDNELPLASMSPMFEGAQVVPLIGDGPVVTQALNRGLPVAEVRAQHPLVQGFDRLAGHLFYDDAAATTLLPADLAPPHAPSFFQRMFTGKAGKPSKGSGGSAAGDPP